MTAGQLHQSLQLKRQEYQYNHTHIPPIAMVDTLAEEEEFSPTWRLMVAKVGFELLVNTIIVNRGDRGKAGAADDVKAFLIETFKETLAERNHLSRLKVLWQGAKFIPKILFGRLSTNAEELEELITDIIKSVSGEFLQEFAANVQQKLKVDSPKGRGDDLKDFQALFQTIDLPEFAYTYETDEVFASMRVAGPNPVMIQRLTTPQANFPITEAHYQRVMGDQDSFTQALNDGRLYIADYGILATAIDGSFPGRQKYLYAPIALFAVPINGDRRLRPVAIQAGQNPQDHNLITPTSNSYAWLCAKTLVQIADANVHEAVTHLARTHLFIGPFAIATHRQLLDNHPVSLLLRPHFQGMLAINNAAQDKLIAPRGGVNKILSCTIDSSRVFAVLGVQSYGFNSAMLPTQLQQRGVDDSHCLPNYPYRDDGLLIWDAIHTWVSDYLKVYYPNDAAVQQDSSLQAWAQELVSHDGGRVVEFGETNGQIQTLNYLIDAITLIIFTASAQHAAVNFPQKDIMSYAPAMPTAGYAPLHNLGEHTTKEDYFSLLPPLSQAQEQLKLLHLLGSTHFTQLGEYGPGYFTNPDVQAPLGRFRNRLDEITDTIHERNRNRPPYDYLLPKNIPQSINI
ncbi:lipoxygenase family protein [Leptothoe kymatousa]|uniref:Lipoxygenase n=1 Tax=Leptothoe kymatousa TAU-MAC 1615 TaxID=2364775 RepID=A0ABS5Y2L9_9CYAN|nr:lipoxygenase family protein [Leptothoe kymatousa]MBT9312060.1 lipoxygenase [Leptothoe kymatousa TAU-MAC 1615]